MKETHNLQELQAAAAKFAASLRPLPDRATVVGLYGDLGAGKTTFVQAIAKAFGVDAHVSSPTFLIVKSYTLKGESFKTLVHIDAYRLKNSDELKKLRFTELLADACTLILVEWANKVVDLLPKDHTKLSFKFIDDATRMITFD